MKIIIFTDLDGTLLHPDTRSFEPAVPALNLIAKSAIPLVFCSSKTRVELDLYRDRLHNVHPYITENGGGIIVPARYFTFSPGARLNHACTVTRLGISYDAVRREFIRLRQRLGVAVRGFGDMSAEEVAERTGLPPAEASLARKREYSEPFFFCGDGAPEFLRAVEEQSLRWTGSGWYCMTGPHDKGAAMRMVKKWYEFDHGKIISIALGDAPNDLPMLKAADYPVLVKNRNGSYDPRVQLSGCLLAPGIGPKGWNEAVLSLLKTI